MTEEQLQVLRDLHKQGDAVCVFTPDELDGIQQVEVEDSMIEAGWDCINALKENYFRR